MNTSQQRPLVLITGASGNLGQSLARALSGSYRVVGLDRQAQDGLFPILQADFSSPSSIDLAPPWPGPGHCSPSAISVARSRSGLPSPRSDRWSGF